jgi:Squalene-hopene cyclase C-terminal domain/WD40-like Beta Propeller Repeat
VFRRKHAILIAAAGFVASTSALIGLRIGRPVYYSDGNRAFAASELRHAGMLRWGAPQPEFALPGPVRGRVAQLPDGRLLYGRVLSPHRTDLVLFDPELVDQEPERVLALGSEGHDLAPAISEDGIWFASDRSGGAGGFDLYRARYENGVFSGVTALDLPGVNTALDETDPAPDPVSGQLVFVRRDPALFEGRNATLWIASVEGGVEPRPLLQPDKESSRLLPALDRDPAFTPRGKALYFVRQRPRREPVLMQTFPHRGAWVEPLPVEMEATSRSTLRAPALLAMGFDLRLVYAGTQGEAMTYRSRAREVRPYWEGQAWIESLLLGLSLVFLTLLVLLTLGTRWHQLDLITKLFLLSVIIHLLLLLWLSRMEIVRSFLPDQPEPGQLEVTILAASHGDRTPGAEDLVAQTVNLAQQARFHPAESALDATAPGVEVRPQPQVAPSTAAPTRPELRPVLAPEAASVAQLPTTVTTRSGRSQDVAIAPTPVATHQQEVRNKTARQHPAQAAPLQVTRPGSDLLEAKAPSGNPSIPHPAQAALPAARQQEVTAQALQDVPAQPRARSGTADVEEQITPLAGKTPTRAAPVGGSRLDDIAPATPGVQPAPRSAQGAEQPLGAGAAPPVSPLAPARRQPGPPPVETHAMPGRAMADPAPLGELRDLPRKTRPGPAHRSAPASTPLARAALPELKPRTPTPNSQRDHPGRGLPITGGLEIPGSFLERVARQPELPGSSSGLAPLDAGLFRNRFGAQKEAALRKYGGGEDTERAVRLGLDYLARIQDRDGSWGRRKQHQKYGRVQVGKTALCLLAFLGAGHTHDSQGKHHAVARRALDFLLRVQDEATGHFGATSSYSHGIATYALAECLAMTKDDKLRAPLEYAVTWTLVNQDYTRDQRNRGGWGYFSPSLRPEDSYARASTTAWQVMALKSAQLSGIKVAQEHLRLAEQFLWRCYDRRNRYFLYTHEPSRLRTSWRTLPASTPASCFCLLLLGNDPKDARLQAGLEYTIDRRPRRYARHSNNDFVRRGAGNVYFWYYGSLAAFLAGGDSWRTWNRALKAVLLQGQSQDGSFQPIDVYAEYAGDSDQDRSYTTAMCVLSLEVYYRYFTPLLRRR